MKFSHSLKEASWNILAQNDVSQTLEADWFLRKNKTVFFYQTFEMSHCFAKASQMRYLDELDAYLLGNGSKPSIGIIGGGKFIIKKGKLLLQAPR